MSHGIQICHAEILILRRETDGVNSDCHSLGLRTGFSLIDVAAWNVVGLLRVFREILKLFAALAAVGSGRRIVGAATTDDLRP